MWRVLAIAALWWPSRVSGILDGPPLDTTSEALLLGLIAPVLVWAHPRFLEGLIPRLIVAAILVLKIGAATTPPDRPPACGPSIITMIATTGLRDGRKPANETLFSDAE